MTLRAEFDVTCGGFELSASFEVPRGSVLAVLGPNGSGKSTLLGCLAGLVAPERATVTLGDRVLDGRGRAVPPHRRGVGLLAQEALLFPHLSVTENVAFAPRCLGISRTQARATALDWLREVDAVELARRKPHQLSGGQAQRVAIARALAGRPRLLLLDEPLAALDVDAAPAIRALLRRVLRDRAHDMATVLVTHDPLDALTLSDHVLVLSAGRIVERGPTREVLAAPRTAFTARIAGLNLVAGTATDDGVRTPAGRLLTGVPAAEVVAGEPAVAVFTPGSVAVHPSGSAVSGSPRNVMDAVVSALEPHGPVVRVRTEEGVSADLTPSSVAELGLEPGLPVRLVVKAAAVTIHPAIGP